MRATTLLVALTATVALPVAAQTLPGEYTPDAHTVLLLHMDEPSGIYVADASGHVNDATATGTTIVPGVFGNARAFANKLGEVAHDYLSVNNSATLNPPNALTIEAWVYLTMPAAGWQNGIPFINRDDSWSGVQGYSYLFTARP